jgi:hypothetical protein
MRDEEDDLREIVGWNLLSNPPSEHNFVTKGEIL